MKISNVFRCNYGQGIRSAVSLRNNGQSSPLRIQKQELTKDIFKKK